MKQWPDNHPKARLLAQKRAAILDAAQEAFLSQGYEGASMESIASAAGVSIMTLYRHARRKEDLFAAIIASNCEHSGDEEELRARTAKMATEEILVEVGVIFQERLVTPEIAALLRVVITEAKRFPNLAAMVHEAFFQQWAENLDTVLARREPFAHLDSRLRTKLCADFFSQLIGTDVLRVLMGMESAAADVRVEQARTAASVLLEKCQRAGGGDPGES